jgi:LemA protein
VVAVIIIVLVLAVVAVWLIFGYNGLVRSRNRMQNAWSQVDVQLKRRHDLVPNLVETVKGYADHEATTLEAVIDARNTAVAAGSVADQAGAEDMLTGALKRLFALAEDYPDLRASDNFQTLQSQLAEIEGDITVARQIYNDTVLTHNNGVETIPTNIVANLTGFERGAFFEIDDDGRSVPRVEF